VSCAALAFQTDSCDFATASRRSITSSAHSSEADADADADSYSYSIGSSPASATANAPPARENLTHFVVLLYLKMPRVDGFEVLLRLNASPGTEPPCP
jgi:CheY-like chemotaxis protein